MHDARSDSNSNTAVARQAGASRQRALLLIGSAVLLAATLALFEPAAHWARDPELLQLLRGMAVIKAGLAVLALYAVWWRLGRAPAGKAFVASYLVNVWVLALATGLIWQLSAIAFASALFHGATITLLVVAWRDMEPRSARQLWEHHRQRPAEGDRAWQRADQRVARRTINPAADEAVDQKIGDDHHRDDQQEEQVFKRQRYG